MTALDALDLLERKALAALHHANEHHFRQPEYWEGQMDAIREQLCNISDLRLKLVGLKDLEPVKGASDDL